MKALVLLVPAALLTGAAARADTAAIQRCRIIPENAARLACYDAIALPGIGSRAGWGAPTGAAPVPPAAPAAGAAPAPGSDFGLPRPASEAAGERVVARVAGRVEDFPAGHRFTLDNGQVWQLTESAIGYYNLENPQVTITRGLFGGFVMSIDGLSVLLKVRRLR